MMHQTEKYSLVEYDDFSVLSMPYTAGELAMVIVLPKKRTGLATVEKALDTTKVESLLNDLNEAPPRETQLSLPKFKIEFGTGLIPAFQSLGMKRAFSLQADFGGITGHDGGLGEIWISQIEHKAMIEVNEEGSEAAAATAVGAVLGGGLHIPSFTADHPFLFLLVDRSTEAILFMGRVSDFPDAPIDPDFAGSEWPINPSTLGIFVILFMGGMGIRGWRRRAPGMRSVRRGRSKLRG